jgi:hypothetical protein
MWILLIVLIVILFLALKYRETFVVRYGNPFNDEDLLSFEPDSKLSRLFGITPDTCPSTQEIDAGLCYDRCDAGYHGVGPVCWADTTNVGIGKVLTPESCGDSGYEGYTDTGLLCSKWIHDCNTWYTWGLVNCNGGGPGDQCYKWTAGCLKTGAKRLTCKSYGDSHPDQIDGLCYARCPEDKPNHVPGMPYLCFKGGRGLSYGRGAGAVPSIFRFGD